ncbi:putative transcriptional regulator [Balneicella halophila]|uniref:UPF0301 protein C7377_1045 n=1 Tax=Balneicella halophila TaxID=1537566 RepID=A0A7L4UNQ7_BALHA|nr:YqgE/AlgH family protein [Balneicella halophila]PVX50731.1 putative transcriptional regulator [Balneicella halophila]
MENQNQKFEFLFTPKRNKIAPAIGRVLIAEPLLQGKFFTRSVILLTEHNHNGSMGLVLNKPLILNVSEAVDLLPTCHSPIYLGGPVHKDHLFYIHTLGNKIPQSYPLSNDLFWGGDLNTLQELLENGEINSHQVRFFTGASGWSLGQLEDELAENSWVVSMLSTDTIMNTESEKLWETAVSELGRRYSHWIHFPESLILN